MKTKLQSRKLWVTVASAAIVSFATQLGLSAKDAHNLVELVGAYLLAQGAHDTWGTK